MFKVGEIVAKKNGQYFDKYVDGQWVKDITATIVSIHGIGGGQSVDLEQVMCPGDTEDYNTHLSSFLEIFRP